MQPSWQLLYPNKSQLAFFLPEINVVSQNCKTQNTPLTLRVIPEQFQTPSGRSFRTLLTSISVLWRCYPYSALYRLLIWTPWSFSAPVKALPVYCAPWSVLNISGVLCLRRALFKALTQKSSSMVTETSQVAHNGLPNPLLQSGRQSHELAECKLCRSTTPDQVL